MAAAAAPPDLLKVDDPSDDIPSPPPDDDASCDDADFYAVLGLARDAGDDDVKRAYRGLAAACHPDKVADPALRPAAADAFAKLQRAHEVNKGEREREKREGRDV